MASAQNDTEIKRALQSTATDSVADHIPARPDTVPGVQADSARYADRKPGSLLEQGESAMAQKPTQPLSEDQKPPSPSAQHQPVTPPDSQTETQKPRSEAQSIRLRKPGEASQDFHGPAPSWLSGKWHITHSTLPTWRDKRNVTITYRVRGHDPIRLDDAVEFDPVFGGAVKKVSGKQVADGCGANNRSAGGGADEGEVVEWDWRGKGLIRVAATRWEVLGWGGQAGREWVLTYFQKTAMTPEGVNLYVRTPETASVEFVGQVKEAMEKTGDQALARLKAEMYEVERK